jgi:hypothetical protein
MPNTMWRKSCSNQVKGYILSPSIPRPAIGRAIKSIENHKIKKLQETVHIEKTSHPGVYVSISMGRIFQRVPARSKGIPL